MTTGPRANTGKTKLTAAQKRAQALEMKLAGMTGAQIGAQLGVTRQRVHQYLTQALAELNEAALDSAAALRTIEDMRLEERRLRIMKLLADHKADPDVVAKLDARLDAISAAKRRLHGLDAPAKTDITSAGQRITLTWPEESDA
jgi:DNA-binding CsgD family transcriptional regulator